jgi:hypothetical protein
MEFTATVDAAGLICNVQFYLRSPAGKRMEIVPEIDESNSTYRDILEQILGDIGVKAQFPENDGE